MVKNILITGVSTGIGYGSAKEFISRGYRVFGSVRKQADADRLKKEFGNSFIPLLFDITDQGAVYQAAEKVKELLNGENLSGLVNNAGAAEGGPLMHMPIEVFQRHLDILVTGQLIVTQAFLPLLGADSNNSKPRGKIINISSVSGSQVYPFMGAYSAAKHAFEGMSDGLRIELQIYGIDVVLICPGMIKTEIWNKQSDSHIEKYQHTDYYKPMKGMQKFFSKVVPKEALELDFFCRKLVNIFEKPKPKPRYTILKKKFIKWTMLRLIPVRMLDKIYFKMVFQEQK